MTEDEQKTTPPTLAVELSAEMRQSYLDYAMSVIVGRALPDVQDGLKPVHRRVLYAMYRMGCHHTKPYKKSAAVVGDVLGKYHPHGDTAVYDTIVRLAQSFSMRYTLIEGQGNFGSVDGDAAAAMRYTEIRMEKLSEELLSDIDKETVAMVKNYDGSLDEPVVLPTRLPNLLVNGSSGIAVGMATKIPPHNIGEVIDAIILYMDNKQCSVDDLMQVLPGPDFPTGGIMMGIEGIKSAYSTGKGTVIIRSRCEIEEEKDRSKIIISEIPYLVNKARMLEKIAELVRNKKLEGISEIRDESNKKGIRAVIVLARGENPQVILNNLYGSTSLQSSFSINMVALHNRQPKLLNLKQVLDAFVMHRKEVITKRTIFDLRQARERSHILEGFAVAIANIDPIVVLIKSSADPKIAKRKLLETEWRSELVETLLAKEESAITRPDGLPKNCGKFEKDGQAFYRLSDKQAQTILELRLQRLTQLEQDKIVTEYKECLSKIKGYLSILHSLKKLDLLVKEELLQIKDTYNDKRRTEISMADASIALEDLIKDEERLITISHRGYCKIQPLDEFRIQRRGGRGKIATTMREEDYIEHIAVGSSLSHLLCFTNFGKVYWVKVHQLPRASRNSRGKPIANIISLSSGERVQALLSVDSFDENSNIIMVTSKGNIKKVDLREFARPRPSGKIAITLAKDDTLAKASLIEDEDADIMLFTSEGRALRFYANQVRRMGRTAKGVRGVKMSDASASVVGLVAIEKDKQIIVATDRGIGKRVDIDQFNAHSRGGKGVAVIPKKADVGQIISVCQIGSDDEIMLITSGGVLIRMKVDSISQFQRGAKGVSLLKLEKHDTLVAMAPIFDGSEI